MYSGEDRRTISEGRRGDDFFQRRMLMLNSLLTEIGSYLALDRILARGLEGAVEMLDGEGGFIVAPETGELVVSHAHRLNGVMKDFRCVDGESPRRVLGLDQPVIIPDAAAAGPAGEKLADAGIASFMAVPVASGTSVRCALAVVITKTEGCLDPRELELLKLLAKGVGVAVNNSLLFDEIKESQRQWQATFDCITDAILIQDENSVIQRSNVWAGRQSGKHPRDLLGLRIDKVFAMPPTEKGDPFEKAMESGEPRFFETHHDGRDYIVSAFPVHDPRGERKSCVHIRKDVTELKRLQNQLFNTEKLLAVGRLVSGVAHEINNPLTGVIGYAELLLRKKEAGVYDRELRKILDSALRCKSIVENLLTFSRQKPQEKQSVDLNRILDNTLALRSYWLRHGNIEVERHYAELPPLMADPQQLQQAVLNILTNAEQAIAEAHGAEGGRITIETFHADGRVLVSITDNGPGIEPELQTKVFDPFFTTREVGQGAGLGLSSSYGVVRENGGDLRVQSEAGRGATFIIELPVSSDRPVLTADVGACCPTFDARPVFPVSRPGGPSAKD